MNEEKPEKVKAEIVERIPETPTPAHELLVPVASVSKLVEAWEQYQELTKKILTKSDYCQIKGEPYKKKSAWRKYAKAFGLSDRIVDKKLEYDDSGKIIRAECTVEVVSPGGRISTGWAACSLSERKFSKPDHDLMAIAHTRAKNRGISDLIGAGELSADEMGYYDDAQANEEKKQSPKQPLRQVSDQLKSSDQRQSNIHERVVDSVEEFIELDKEEEENARLQIAKLDKLSQLKDSKTIIDAKTRSYGKDDYRDLDNKQRTEILKVLM